VSPGSGNLGHAAIIEQADPCALPLIGASYRGYAVLGPIHPANYPWFPAWSSGPSEVIHIVPI
jgi:hypothetical protein